MDKKIYDVFVIGTGTAGQTVARKCAKEGLSVAIADNRAYGGACPNRGCMPKKVLLAPTEAWQLSQNLTGKGVVEPPKLDWKKLQKFKKTFTKDIPVDTENDLKDLGIDLYHQSPKFIDKTMVLVEGKEITAKKFVIATGLQPVPLDCEGGGFSILSDDFLDLEELPKSMTFVGAGYIGMEFAHMAARAGVKVTVIDRSNSILSAFDPEMTTHLKEASVKLGIEFILDVELKKIEKLKKNIRLHLKVNGKTKTIKSNLVVNTAGRFPDLSALQLDKASVSFSKSGVAVDPYLRNPTNLNVYACGDVSEHSLPLSPLSGYEGNLVAENILNDDNRKIEVPVVPSVVFTLPNLASVGYSEEEAKHRFKNVKVNYKSVPNWFNAKRINEGTYAFKIISNERTEEILGAHLIGENASETINLFAMAINEKITISRLKRMIFTYPSWSNDIKSMI